MANPNDDIYNSYLGQNTSTQDGNDTVFFGIDSLLDFRLAEGAGPGKEGLRDVIKDFKGPQTLFDRLEDQRNRALNRGEIGRYLVTFVDNHDSFWQPGGRFGANAPQEQIIAAIGYLLCSLGTAVIYYGTEQGFQGQGGDNQIREAMFDKNKPGVNLLNSGCTIYQEIAKIAAVIRSTEPLRFGRMYFREISGDKTGEPGQFGLPLGTGSVYTLAFSRILFGREVLVAFNVSTEVLKQFVIVDADIQKNKKAMTYLYGKSGTEPVLKRADPNDPTRFLHLELQPRQFVILE